MYPVSDLFKQYIVRSDREFEIQAVIAGITYSDGAVIDFTIEDTIVPGEELTIGSVITSRLTLGLKTEDVVPTNAKVSPSVRMNGPDGYTEWVQLSDFWIDERSFQNNVWRFTCFDRLLISNQEYISTLVFPASQQDVWTEVTGQMGLASDGSVQIDPTYTIDYEPLDYSMRDMLSFIAMAHGASVAIAKNGSVKWVRPGSGVQTPIGAADYVTAEKTNSPKTIAKIELTYNEDGEQLIAGTGTADQTLRLINPFMTQAMLDTVYAMYNGFTYTPFTMNWKGRPDLECGDPVLITMRDASTIPSIILTNKMSFKGGLLATSTAPSVSEDKKETNYKDNLKSFIINNAVMQEKPYYGVSIGRKFGIKITRSDGKSKAILNSDYLYFQGENNSIMFNEWGFNPDFIKRFPNKIINSGFEWYDEETKEPIHWQGTGRVTLESNWEGDVALLLEAGQYIEQGNLTANSSAGPNPAWWDHMQTRVSLKYKGGGIRVRVKKVSDNTEYIINDNSAIDNLDDTIVSGLYLDYPASKNWEEGYVSFYFQPEVDAGRVKVHIENVDGSTAYIDAIQIEPDFTGRWPSLYSPGPRSAPMGDLLGVPGGGGIFYGPDASKPGVGTIIRSVNVLAHGLGYSIPTDTFWVVTLSGGAADQYNLSGQKVGSIPLGSTNSPNGCEVDRDDSDILWITASSSYLQKWKISTQTRLGQWPVTSAGETANGVCAPPGDYVYVGINGPNQIRKIRKSDGATISSGSVGYTVSDLAWDGQFIWASFTNTKKIQAFNLNITLDHEFDGPSSDQPGLTHDGNRLWVANGTTDTLDQIGEGGSFPAIYFATDTKKIYWNVNDAWVFAGSSDHGKLDGLADDDHPIYLTAQEHAAIAHTLLGLTDVPDSFAGNAGKVLAIKSTEDGIEFVAGGAGGSGVASLSEDGSTLLTGDIKLKAGTGIVITQTDIGKIIEIAATAQPPAPGGGTNASLTDLKMYDDGMVSTYSDAVVYDWSFTKDINGRIDHITNNTLAVTTVIAWNAGPKP